jgi:hypothetical protein
VPGPDRLDRASGHCLRFPRDRFGSATWPVIVREKNEAIHACRDGNPAEPLIAERGPDGDAEQDHGGERGFDAFRQTEDVGGIRQHDGAAGRAPQHATRISKVSRTAGEHRVQEGPLDGYDAGAFLNGGEHCGTKDELAPRPEWRARVKAKGW